METVPLSSWLFIAIPAALTYIAAVWWYFNTD